jgi:prepilin-type N-terminal cleavage/methylation domain-containing protein
MKKSGFSLLELLIVIIIIGVLAVVAYTQYKNMTEKSRYTEAYTVLTNIRAAQFKYYERNNGWATSFVNLPTDRVLIGTTATPADLINLFYFGYCLDGGASSASAYRLHSNEGSKNPGLPASVTQRPFLRVNYTTGNFTKGTRVPAPTGCGN